MRRHENEPGVSWREQSTKRRAGATQQTGPYTEPVTKKSSHVGVRAGAERVRGRGGVGQCRRRKNSEPRISAATWPGTPIQKRVTDSPIPPNSPSHGSFTQLLPPCQCLAAWATSGRGETEALNLTIGHGAAMASHLMPRHSQRGLLRHKTYDIKSRCNLTFAVAICAFPGLTEAVSDSTNGHRQVCHSGFNIVTGPSIMLLCPLARATLGRAYWSACTIGTPTALVFTPGAFSMPPFAELKSRCEIRDSTVPWMSTLAGLATVADLHACRKWMNPH